MTRKITLFDRAKTDLQSARLILPQSDSDELLIDVAAYHVQQGIEKLVKFALTINGVKHRQTHDMAILHEQLEGAGIMLFPWLYKNIDTINSMRLGYEMAVTLMLSQKKIIQLLNLAEELLPVLQPLNIEDDATKPESFVDPS